MPRDAELIRAILSGDAKAEADFIDAYRPRLVRASAHFVGGHGPEADEVVGETFRVFLMGMKRREFREPVYVWLRRICMRLCYARLRGRGRALAGVEENLEAFLRHRARPGSDDAGKRARLEFLDALAAGLDPESRRIVYLRETRGMSCAQIGRTLGLSLDAVLERLAGAKGRILEMENIRVRRPPPEAG